MTLPGALPGAVTMDRLVAQRKTYEHCNFDDDCDQLPEPHAG